MGLLFFLKCAFVCDAQLIDPGVKISCGAVTVELRNGVNIGEHGDFRYVEFEQKMNQPSACP